ncbi:MAG: helix-turn-helix transcriptional regulator [Bacteroidota bacterium]
MKERLLQLLDLEHLSPSKFADLIGVQRSSVSHVLSGRNNPSYDFLQKTLKAFPGLKADWLMLGQGIMYEHMGRVGADLFARDPRDQVFTADLPFSEMPATVTGLPEGKERGIKAEQTVPKDAKMTNTEGRNVVQVMIFYDDDTFSSFKPSQ